MHQLQQLMSKIQDLDEAIRQIQEEKRKRKFGLQDLDGKEEK